VSEWRGAGYSAAGSTRGLEAPLAPDKDKARDLGEPLMHTQHHPVSLEGRYNRVPTNCMSHKRPARLVAPSTKSDRCTAHPGANRVIPHVPTFDVALV
jgi:hypothetical protein